MSSPDRVISIALSNDEWRAFVQAQPQPVEWLKARIQESIESARTGVAPGTQPIGRA
jgi:hypothetical protein